MREFCNLRHHGTGARCHKTPAHEGNHVGYAHFPGQVVSWTERARQDRLGRRIGYNWWREYNCDLLLDASLSWERQAEAVALGYPTETAEYARDHPRPTLKAFLVANAGMNKEPEGFPETEREMTCSSPS